MGGNYEMPMGGIHSQGWSTAFAGESGSDIHIIGNVKGDVWDSPTGIVGHTGNVEGKFSGLYFDLDESTGKLHTGTVGIVNGEAAGIVEGSYIEVTETTGTWNAAAAGDWVEVTDLLTTDKLGFTIEQLHQFVSVPVTEVYSSVLNNGVGSVGGGVAMTNVFSDFLSFVFNSWAENKWDANYTGAVGGNAISGQAGGTYADNVFAGVGAGMDIPNNLLNTVVVSGDYVTVDNLENPANISNMTANVVVYNAPTAVLSPSVPE